MRNHKLFKISIQGAVFVLIFAGAFSLAHFAKDSEAIREAVSSYGYFSIFIVSLISGFNLIVPVPAASFMPLFLESGLDFWITLFVLVTGISLADSVSYFLGRFGKQVTAHVTDGSFLMRIVHLRTRFRVSVYTLLFFYAAFVPLPNELLLAPLGFLGYRFIALFPIIIIGNFVFNAVYGASVVGLFNAF